MSPGAPTSSSSVDTNRWFEQEVHAHDARLKAYLRGAYPEIRDIDDVVQESYLRVWRRQLARPIISVRAFLFAVARNLALDTLRHERSSPFDRLREVGASDAASSGAGIAEEACTAEEFQFLISAIDLLTPKTREVFILRRLEGLSPGDISRRLGISLSTIETHLWKANRHCQAYLRRHGVIDGP